MQHVEALRRFATSPIARLATIRPDSTPHLVPVTFALVGETVVTAIDHKPKTTERLQRLINIDANPDVSLLVDHYSDDWDRLWWVRIDGRATVHPSGDVWDRAIDALIERYRQYVDHPPEGPVIEMTIDRVTSWASTR